MSTELKDRSIFITSILLLSSILFIFLQPKVLSMINPGQHREELLKTFINDTTQNNQINAQKFWETREYYSPGTFEYNHDGFTQAKMNEILKAIEIPVRFTDRTIPFLTFKSVYWTSVEMLVESADLNQLLVLKPNKPVRTITQTDEEWIYQPDEQTMRIIFVKSIDEMKTANGFFDYPGYDKEYVKGKYWLSISEIKM